MDKAQKTGANT